MIFKKLFSTQLPQNKKKKRRRKKNSNLLRLQAFLGTIIFPTI